MKLIFKKHHRIQWPFFIVALSVLLSCTSYLTYEGHEVAKEDRIEIKEGGPNKGAMRTYDLILDYVYEQKKDGFTLSGKISWSRHIEYNFRTLEHFSLKVYFVDSFGKIIEGKDIVRSGHNVEIENLSFEKHLTLPAGAVAMVFSYSGRATEHGTAGNLNVQGGQTDWEFWKSPVRRKLFH